MKKIVGLRPIWLFVIFAILDTMCIGMGMGVPIFCILFGFVVGWVAARHILSTFHDLPQVFRRILWAGVITAGITMIGMLILWLPLSSYLFDPAKDLANTGIPLILYTPYASLIGWIALMVLISPFLQLLTTLFGSYMVLIGWNPKDINAQKVV